MSYSSVFFRGYVVFCLAILGLVFSSRSDADSVAFLYFNQAKKKDWRELAERCPGIANWRRSDQVAAGVTFRAYRASNACVTDNDGRKYCQTYFYHLGTMKQQCISEHSTRLNGRIIFSPSSILKATTNNPEVVEFESVDGTLEFTGNKNSLKFEVRK